ncbi:phosphate ABC transporter substrate-binding protein [Thalassotalea fusca]
MKNSMLSIFLLGAVSFSSVADVAVIVHPSNADALDSGNISKIFLGKSKKFPSGEQAVPVSQQSKNPIRVEFDRKVLNKSSSQVKAHWSKLLFTGKGQPPKEAITDGEVIELVANNPNIIGFVDASQVDATVKVVATF